MAGDTGSSVGSSMTATVPTESAPRAMVMDRGNAHPAAEAADAASVENSAD